MPNPENPYTIEPIPEHRETESNAGVPTLDVVRHGKTAYKELKDPDFKFDPDAEDFALDADHLDLTPEGIEDIKRMAARLADRIDPEREAVFLFSSPSFRAQSTALIIEQSFREHGIELVNTLPQDEEQDTAPEAGSRIRLSHMLEQIIMKDPSRHSDFSKGHDEYFDKYPEARDTMPVATRHADIAAQMGSSVEELFVKGHDQLDREMKRWIRHMINIESHLGTQTKEILRDKRIRIIGVTHEERIDELAADTFGEKVHVRRGQMMEIMPTDRLASGTATDAHVTLYEPDGTPAQEQDIRMHFNKPKQSEE